MEKNKVKIDFNEPHITYRNKNGEKVVGVTTALGLLAKQALIPWAYNRGKAGLELYESKDKAANIGTIVHFRILAYYKGYEVDNSNIAPDVWETTEKSMQSFYEWAKNRNVKPIIIEKPFVHEELKYGGTPDLYGLVDNELTLVDFKTGSNLYDEHFIQLAAYLKLIISQGHEVKKVIILNVPKSKGDSFQIKSISADNLETEFQLFLKCTDIYYLQKSIKENKSGGLN
jgi:hypothetical protein